MSEKLTQAAADQMADSFAQALLALAGGDGDGRDAEVAKMKTIVDNPKNRS